jgi:DNA-binding CsgD family transcriptional regulator
MHTFIDLSIQEKKILHLVSLGLKSKQIAEKLFISPHTVKNHKSNICLKINLKTTAELYIFTFYNAALLQEWGGIEGFLTV